MCTSSQYKSSKGDIFGLVAWSGGNTLRPINEAALHRAVLVLGGIYVTSRLCKLSLPSLWGM